MSTQCLNYSTPRFFLSGTKQLRTVPTLLYNLLPEQAHYFLPAACEHCSHAGVFFQMSGCSPSGEMPNHIHHLLQNFHVPGSPSTGMRGWLPWRGLGLSCLKESRRKIKQAKTEVSLAAFSKYRTLNKRKALLWLWEPSLRKFNFLPLFCFFHIFSFSFSHKLAIIPVPTATAYCLCATTAACLQNKVTASACRCPWFR